MLGRACIFLLQAGYPSQVCASANWRDSLSVEQADDDTCQPSDETSMRPCQGRIHGSGYSASGRY